MSLRVTMAIYNMEIEINRKRNFIEHYFLRCAFFFSFYYCYYLSLYIYIFFFIRGLVVHYKLNKSHHVSTRTRARTRIIPSRGDIKIREKKKKNYRSRTYAD